MNKKNWIWILIAIAVIIVGVFIYKNQINKQEDNVIKIGAILPLTGDFSFYGNEVKKGLSIAEQENSNIHFVIEDNLSLTKNSVPALNKILNNEKVPVFISSNSPLSMPLRIIAAENKIVMLALVTGAKDFGMENEWCFRDAINQDQEGIAQAKYIINNTSYKKVAILCVNDDYGLSGAKSFSDKFKELGGQVSGQQTFEMKTNDMKNLVLSLLDKNPDFILTIGREQSLIKSINQIRLYNKNLPIITSDSFESNNVFKGIGNNAIGIIFTSYQNDLKSLKAQNFINKYKSNYKTDPGIYAIDAYVAGSYLSEIIRQNKTPDLIRQALTKLDTKSEIKGELITDKRRNIVSPIAVYKINSNLQKEQISIIK